MINEEVEIGLHANYWKGLKDFYENDYDGIAPGDKGSAYAEEMIQGGASILSYDRPFDPDDILTWIEGTMDMVREDEDEDIEYDNETIIEFPNVDSYDMYYKEIAAYMLLKDLDKFRNELKNDNQEYKEEAIRLNWTEMLEEIPEIADIFLF